MISFNKIYITGKELEYISRAYEAGNVAGNGHFTKKCEDYFTGRFGFNKSLLTNSGTGALEISAILIDIQPGDEVIIPSFTYVSTANAFVLRGAEIVFADTESGIPNLDVSKIEKLITKKTKAIVPIHYAGIACRMEEIKQLAEKYDLFVIEDAAHAIDSFYKDKRLGSIGDLAVISFHETKNISSVHGGLLIINNDRFIERAEKIRENGTNRAAFLRGETDKYQWVDIGSSYKPSEIHTAILYAQLEKLDEIQAKRKKIWEYYYNNLKHLEEKKLVLMPQLPDYASNNAHIFFLICSSEKERNELIKFLNDKKIQSIFHFQSLHSSLFFRDKHDGRKLPNSEKFSRQLVRLPLYYDLIEEHQDYIIESITEFYKF